MKFLEDYLKGKCINCNICCRFPERYSPLVPYFLNNEIKDDIHFSCIGNFYGCKINLVKYKDIYACPYFLPEENKCSVYEKRPIDCRLYPFMITYNSDYKKVVLVLDNNCPYSKELVIFKDDILKYVDLLNFTMQNIGFINDPQPNTIFIEELPKLTKFVFGESKRFRKLTAEDKNIIPYLWKDIMNILYEEKTKDKLKENNKEYIYLKKDLIELKGDRYKDKRNLCNYFQNNYSFTIKKLIPTPDNISSCLSLYKQWGINKGRDKDPYYKQLIEDSFFFHKRALLDFDKLEILGIEIKIDGKLIGYTFGSGLKNDTFCVLGEITDLKYKGINQFIFREFCKIIPDNYVYINTMDDSEIFGLRKNKLSYHPIKIIGLSNMLGGSAPT